MEKHKFNRLLKEYAHNHHAAKELYEYYFPIIVKTINWKFNGKVDGRDIAQQFFLNLFDNRNFNIRSPNAWVFKVSTNIAIDTLRKENKYVLVEDITKIQDISAVPDEISDTMKTLTETEQKIVYLLYWQKFKLKEIAEMLELSYDMAKYHHKKAKRKLRKNNDLR